MSTKSKLKSKITFITTTTLSALALTTGLTAATTVHADATTAPANEPTTKQTETTTTQSSLKTQQDASRQAVADANKANDEAQGDVKSAADANRVAQTAVNNAQTNVNDQTKAVTNAQTEINNASAEVNGKSDAAQAAQSQYDQAVKDASANQQAIADAQKANDEAQADVKTATKAADQANSDVNAKSDAATTADQNATKAQQTVDNDTAAVSQAQLDVKAGTDALANAKNHDQVIADDTAAVKSAQDQKNAADTKVNDAQKTVDEKNNDVKTASDGVQSAQQTVDGLKNDGEQSEIQQSIPVTQEWIDFVKSTRNKMMSEGRTEFTEEEGQKFQELNNKIVKNLPWETINNIKKQTNYKTDATLAKIPVQLESNHQLSKDDQIFLNQTIASLINQFLEQTGQKQFTITENSMANNNSQVGQYNSDNWNYHAVLPIMGVDGDVANTKADPAFPSNMWGQHDTNNMTKHHISAEVVGGTNGANAVFEPNTKPGDTGHYEYSLDWVKNRDDLQRVAYDSVLGWIFQDGTSAGHARILLRMVPVGNHISFQFNKFNQLVGDVEDPNYQDTSALIPLSSTGYDTTAIKSAHDSFVKAQNDYDNFVAAHQNDDLELNHIMSEQDYQNNKQKYDADPNDAWAPTYKASMDLYVAQQKALKPYLDAINNAQAKLDQVYFTKTSDGQDSHAKALADAQQGLSEAQTKLASAQANAKTAQDAYNAAKSQADSAAKALADAQAKLSQDSSNVMSVADAQAKLDKANNALKTAQANLKQDAANLDRAKAVQASAHAALDNAKKAAKSANDALANAQKKADETQAKLSSLTKKNPKVEEAETALNKAKQDLQVAQSKLDQAKAKLANAQDALASAKADLKTAQTNAKTAKANLKAAQAKAKQTAEALKQAQANLISDAKVYGDSVAVKDQTVEQNGQVQAPEIANPMADDPTQSQALASFLAVAHSSLDTIPTGTKAEYKDANQLVNDIKTPGHYTEDVLVTFPDHSTTTIKGNLIVTPAKAQPSTPTKPNQSQPSQSSKDNGQTSGATTGKDNPGSTSTTKTTTGKTNGGSTVTPDGETSGKTSGATVKTPTLTNNSAVISDNAPAATTVVTTTNATNEGTTVKRSDLNNGKLPQTSNKDQSGLVALGLVTLIGMFGLAGARRKN